MDFVGFFSFLFIAVCLNFALVISLYGIFSIFRER